ncbi:hypothetical protein SAMN05444320_11350 [Streptoalloteichus hindustanus]|uniref:Uncharacterized protein n=1 Tax=Streptoalloteichus hindustanus TaxID=2017 RepID=A0A1M5MAB7_STRHI|nr:hypothetical protein SAMN05444320_11350 [Streptoalloteichus hindustanus]
MVARIEHDLTAALHNTTTPPCDTPQRAGTAQPEPLRIPLPTSAEVRVALAPQTGSAHTRRRARHYHRTARFHSARRADEHPAIRLAGALVSVHIDPDRPRPTLCVSVDLDEVVDELRSLRDETVALRIQVRGESVYVDPVE